MKEKNNYLYSKDARSLQIPYGDYVALMEKVEEAQKLKQLKAAVVADLTNIFGKQPAVVPASPKVAAEEVPPAKVRSAEKVSIEFSAEVPEPKPVETAVEPRGKQKFHTVEIPPIKKEIAEHFNQKDSSGRLFNVFKQYYTFLNEACGGTVRVTMKDGVCSFWNYDAWEEFAFADIFEGQLRIAFDPRHTDEVKSLNLCEVPRLLSSRWNLICVKVDDLSNIVLDVLAKAFGEIGVQAV